VVKIFSNQLFSDWVLCSPITHTNNLIITASSFVTENLSEVELWKMDANMSVNNPVNNNKTTTINGGFLLKNQNTVMQTDNENKH